MKLSAFTFIRNGTILGYPYIESIRSILPIVDEFVVNVGYSDDDTLAQVRELAGREPKIRILESAWNERMAQKGFVYAQQKMIAQYNCTGDWAFYLEGDEVVHEADLPGIRQALEQYLDDPRVEAFAFQYYHFYGTPAQLAISPSWYRRDVRIIRNTIRTYAPDGLYWTVMERHKRGRFPRAVVLDAHMYHYGHVRSTARMQEKLNRVSRYWGHAAPKVDYGNIDPQALAPFTGTHPAIVRPWLATEAEQAFTPNPQYQLSRREKKHRLAMKVEKLLGVDLSKKHFVPVKD